MVPVLLAAFGGIVVPGTTGGFTSLVPDPGATASALNRLNRMDATTFNLSSIGGPALVGALAATIGPAQALLVVCGIATVGAAAALTIPPGEPVAEDRPGDRGAAVRAGLRQVVSEPPLRAATLTSAIGWGSVGMLMVVLPLYAARVGGQPTYSGYLWTALEVGCLISTLTLARKDTRRPERRVLITTAVFGAIMLSWPLAPSLLVALPLLLLAGVASGPTLPALFAARQQYSPPDLLSQVSTTGASLKIGTFALGSVIGGTAGPRVGRGQGDRAGRGDATGRGRARMAGRRPEPGRSTAQCACQ